MEDVGTWEEYDDIDSQDSNTQIDHGHLARNCSIKNILMTGVIAFVSDFIYLFVMVRKIGPSLGKCSCYATE